MPFKKGDLFKNILVDKAYKRLNQKIMFGKLLSTSVAGRYINDREFLEIGHLAPRADFIFDSLQGATSYFANAGPQWHSFNCGNWEKLEMATRKLVAKKFRALTIYTGTYGTYKINGTKMYLASDSSGKYTMPIPMAFWKVVLEDDNERAVAFIGLNDPYADVDDNPARHICAKDVCPLIGWVDFNPDPKKGLMYCCELNDFTKAVFNFKKNGIKYGLLNN